MGWPGAAQTEAITDDHWECPMMGGGAAGPAGTSISPELQRMANLLGLTPAELQTQLQQGKSLAQIAQAKSITRQSLLDAILAPLKDTLPQRVKYGYLTQAQADTILQQELASANAFIDRVFPSASIPGQGSTPGYGPGYGGMMGRGMMGGDNSRGGGMMGGGMMGGMMGGGMMGGMMGGGMMGGGFGPGSGMMGPGMMGGFGGYGPGGGGMMGGWGR